MRTLTSPYHRLYIDSRAVVRNLAALRAVMPPRARVAAVIKADAYGHGAAHLAPILKRAGVEALAVAKVSEAQVLRQNGISGPIWLLLGAHEQDALSLVQEDLWPVTADMTLLRAMAGLGRDFHCIIKVDTGMSRLGLRPQDVAEFLAEASALPNIKIMGLQSHLAHGGDGLAPRSDEQMRCFNQLLHAAREKGHALECSSMLNSGGIICPPTDAFAQAYWVRPGVALYGGLPDSACMGKIQLHGVMRLHSRIMALRRVNAGEKVSYGGTYTVPRDTTLAIVPVGYAEGYHRALSNRAFVLINGQLAPVRGRVCMNMIMVDVGHMNPLPALDNEVVLLGRQGENKIDIDDLGQWAETIGYEIMCSLGAGLPHYYMPEEE